MINKICFILLATHKDFKDQQVYNGHQHQDVKAKIQMVFLISF